MSDMAAVTRKDVSSVLHASKGGIVIDIEVSPGSKVPRLGPINPWRKSLGLSVKAQPKKGKANHDVALFLAEMFGISVNDVVIISGATSSQKRVEISGISLEDATSVILEALNGTGGGPDK